jgi:large subunit ribosomal protein L18
MKISRDNKRKKIHQRIRQKIKGTTARPRLTVFRSNRDIYCQLIDDQNGNTIACASSKDSGADAKGTKTEIAKNVGSVIADKAKTLNIESIVFDRGGYLYHGRVKALAEGAREGGLKF